MENKKTIGIYSNNKTSIIIENIVTEKQVPFSEYLKFSKSGNPLSTFFIPKEGDLIDENNRRLKLQLFCVAEENGKKTLYYKSVS